jgi:CRP-like cAMP-binding protein
MVVSLFGSPLTAALTEQQRPVTFAPGDCIFHAGEQADGCYLLDTGSVRLGASNAREAGAAQGLLVPGDILDVGGILSGRTRATSAYAHSAVRARWLPSGALAALFHEVHGIWPVLLTSLAHATDLPSQRVAAAQSAEGGAELVARAAAAQQELAAWAGPYVKRLLHDLAFTLAERAEHLASAAAAELGGDHTAEMLANRRASVEVYAALAREANGSSNKCSVTPGVGIVLSFVPQRFTVAAMVAATLLALHARRALILSCHGHTRQVCRHVAALVRGVLARHGALPELVQWMWWGTQRDAAIGRLATGEGAIVLVGGADASQMDMRASKQEDTI